MNFSKGWSGFILVFMVLIVFSAAMTVKAAEMKNADQQAAVFSDLTADDADAVFINYLTGRSIIQGFEDGTFRPLEGLTRAQAAALMTRAAGITPDAALPLDFSDVGADYWGKASIAAAVKAGFVKGFPDNSYHPEEKITRAQAATMVLRLSQQKLNDANDIRFSDVSSNHWAAAPAATAVAAGMMLAGNDGQQFEPDRAMTRAEMARALTVLLVEDPQLYRTQLQGTLEVKQGTVSISKGLLDPVVITAPTAIEIGDTIVTAANSEAAVTFMDGSGLLLKAGTRLKVTDAYGRSYIKQDGSPGVAVEWLNVNLLQGELFGIVPDMPSNSNDNSAKANVGALAGSYLDQFRSPLLASLVTPGLIAASGGDNNNPPWYNTAKTKRVKVKVDMPWGVAAVRGTQFFIGQNTRGTYISVLGGSVTATSNTAQAGKNTYDIGAGQAAQIGSTGAFSAPPGAMTPEQLRNWVNAGEWLRQQAAQIQQNLESSWNTPPTPSSQLPTQQPPPADLTDTLNRALQEAQRNMLQNTPSGSRSSSSGSGTVSITSLELPENTALTVTCGEEYILPTTVTANYSDGTKAAVTVSWNPSTVDTTSPGTKTFTGTVSGSNGSVELVLVVEEAVISPHITSLALPENTPLTVTCGEEYILPAQVTANYSDGTKAAIDVIWNPSTVNTTLPGEQTFTGTVSGFDGSVELVLVVAEPEKLGEILGSYQLTDALILDDYIYDNGVLTQDLIIIPSDALAARADSYKVFAFGNYYGPIISYQQIDQSFRVMKKLFDNAEQLYITFLDNNGMVVANAGFDESGQLINLGNRTISGQIILPEGMVAPPGGMLIMLQAYAWPFENSVPILIKAGESQADYSIEVVYHPEFMPYSLESITEAGGFAAALGSDYRNSPQHGMQPLTYSMWDYRLHYQVVGDYAADLIKYGNYDDMINAANDSWEDINLNLAKGQVISGVIKLPESQQAESDLRIYVEATGRSNYYCNYYDPVLIQAGCGEAAFSLAVPENNQYLLGYQIFDQANRDEPNNGHLLREGYYNLSGSVYDGDRATEVAVADTAVTDINFELLRGRQVRGMVKLPEGRMASRDTIITASVTKEEPDYYISYSAAYFLPQGGTSVAYVLVVPAELGVVTLQVYAWPDGVDENAEVVISNEDVVKDFVIELVNSGEHDPTSITAPALLIGENAYALNSLDFAKHDNIKGICSNFTGYAYLKTSDGLWFNLMAPALDSAAALNSDNAVAAENLPPIYGKFEEGIWGVDVSDENNKMTVTFKNLPQNTRVRIYDALEGGDPLGSGTFAADGLTITFSTTETDIYKLYFTFTPEGQPEYHRIRLPAPPVVY